MNDIDLGRGERLVALDAIRGVAVMGILAMNIVAFALPFSAYGNPAAGGAPPVGDFLTWLFNFLFVDSKMRGLFSMLFGASTLLVIESATARGRNGAAAHYSRMIWLALFGLAHFYLIWHGDILFLYALCGLWLFFFRNLSVKALIGWAIAFFIVQMGIFTSYWAFMAMAESGLLPASVAEEMQLGLAKLNADMGANSPDYGTDVALFRGSYADILAYRLIELAGFPIGMALLFFWETMGLMLTGMALFRSRMLTGEWGAARYLKWAVISFLIATPPLIMLAFYQINTGYSAMSILGATVAFSIPFDVIMTIGWAALIMWMIKAVTGDRVTKRLAAAGRMAFSNYIGTSIVMTTIFYGYGLGLFGSVSRAALYLFCFAMWALILSWSKPWLARFHYGPLEWLWRSLSHRALQPMRKSVPLQ